MRGRKGSCCEGAMGKDGATHYALGEELITGRDALVTRHYPMLVTLADGRQRWLAFDGDELVTGGDASVEDAAKELVGWLNAMVSRDCSEIMEISREDHPESSIKIGRSRGPDYTEVYREEKGLRPSLEASRFLQAVVEGLASVDIGQKG